MVFFQEGICCYFGQIRFYIVLSIVRQDMIRIKQKIPGNCFVLSDLSFVL